MLLLIVGVICIILGVMFANIYFDTASLLVLSLGYAVCMLCVFIPISGFKGPDVIEEYELLPLIPDTNVYIIKDTTGKLMYKYKQDGKEIIKCQSSTNTLFKELGKGESPVVKETIVVAKKTLWAFPIDRCYYETLLYVPKNGIVK